MDDPRRLVDALAEIATLAAEPFDVELLRVAAVRVRDVLALDGVAMFVSADGDGVAWAMPSVGVPGLDRMADLPDSPCHASLRTGEVVTGSIGDPGCHHLLSSVGVRSIAAVPLRHRDRVLGVLLLAARDGCLDPVTISDASRFADVIAAGLVREHAHRLQQTVNEQLQRALDARVVVEQAKGMIAAELGVEIDVALDTLRGFARRHQLKLHEVAADIVSRTLPPAILRAS